MGKDEFLELPRSLIGIVKPPTEAERKAIEQRVHEKVAQYKATEAAKKQTEPQPIQRRPLRRWTIPEKLDEMAEKFKAQNHSGSK